MAGSPKKRANFARLQGVGEEYLLERMAEGWSQRKISAEFGVATSMVSLWINETPERAARFARAREEAAELMVDDIIDIADESNDARLRVDTRRWIASKRLPGTYGDHRPSLTVNIAAAHLTDLRGLLVAVEQPRQALDVSDAMVIGDASMQDDQPAISVTQLKTT
jgi:transcriptional regulator with XRE-family HTH domain